MRARVAREVDARHSRSPRMLGARTGVYTKLCVCERRVNPHLARNATPNACCVAGGAASRAAQAMRANCVERSEM
eukprot:5950953-Prymnesium_polylepis.1